ncbi:MAG: prolipoprotein diacylglyceryl transferase [Deltaproteobacteria bacterium]|nr:prolipoprotein diacylglyceryl transferase [Deltaproteobacteria bacterium]
MHPTLLRVFGIEVPAYFGMLAIGFSLATWVGARWLGRLGHDKEVVIDLGLAMVLAGVLGARLLHVLADGFFWDYVHLCTDPSKVDWHISHARCVAPAVDGVWDEARRLCHPKERSCFAWAAFWAGGLTYYGGFLGASGYAVYFLRRERFPFWKAADMAGFAIPLGLAWGRLGCFLAGCCFGRVCTWRYGARFPAWSPASEAHFRAGLLPSEGHPALPVYPAQLFESAGCLVIAAVAYAVVAQRKRWDGQVFVFFLVGYAVLRGLLELLRADDRGGLLGVSTSQWISLGLLAAAYPLARALRARSAANAAPAPSAG